METLFEDITLIGESVAAPSHIPTSVLLLLRVVGNRKVRVWSGLQRHNVSTKFFENPPTDTPNGDMQTHAANPGDMSHLLYY
jgi:hypothetical protein